MRTLLTLGFSLLLTSAAWAVPQAGQGVPAFSVDDLAGVTHTQRDLLGRWSIVVAFSDKDAGSAVDLWYRRVTASTRAGSRVLTLCALNLFPLIPTETILVQARDATARARWGDVWLSRNGSLAESLGLPGSETPWVFVVDPAGRVVESVHAQADDPHLARVLTAFNRGRP
jgi:hypothetical protein